MSKYLDGKFFSIAFFAGILFVILTFGAALGGFPMPDWLAFILYDLPGRITYFLLFGNPVGQIPFGFIFYFIVYGIYVASIATIIRMIIIKMRNTNG